METASQPIPRWRWWIHCTLLTGYLLAAFIRPMAGDGPQEAALPPDIAGLLWVSFTNLALFAIVIGLAWLASRASLDDFGLRWRGGILPALLGFVYSIVLRLGLFMIMMIVMVGVIASKGEPAAQSMAEVMRPDTGKVISVSALTGNPVYLWLCLTLVSFVVAGFREELWRVALLTGILKILEPRIRGWPAKLVAVGLTSTLFGLAHFPQGWGAVVLTGLLGLGFGIIILAHRSVWEAVLAHGFFDASTFLGIYLLLKYFPGKVPGF
jgi:membrane protease YdiL (CAAX protease family)